MAGKRGTNTLAVHILADSTGLGPGLAAAQAEVKTFQKELNSAANASGVAAGEQALRAEAMTTAQVWASSRQAMVASERRASALLKAGRKADSESLASALSDMEQRRDAFLAATRSYYGGMTEAQRAAFALQNTAANAQIESEYQRIAARIDDTAAIEAETAALDENTAATVLNGGAAREATYMLDEILAGRWRRLAASSAVMSNRLGLMQKLFTPLGLSMAGAAAAAGVFVGAIIGGERESAAFNRAILMTGNAAGLTEGEFNAMAASIEGGATTIGAARDALLTLARSGRFTSSSLQLAAQATVDFAQITGESTKQAATAVERLAARPAQAVAQLNAQYHFLTVAELEHIQALVREGDATGAAQAAVEAFASAMRQRAQEAAASEGIILRGWYSIKDAISGAWQALESFGADNTVEQRIAKIRSQIQTLQAYGRAGFSHAGEVANLQAQLRELEAQKQKNQELAREKAQQDTINAAGIQAEQDLQKRIAGLRTGNELERKRLQIVHEIEALHRANPNDKLLAGDTFNAAGALVRGNATFAALIAKLQRQLSPHPLTLHFARVQARDLLPHLDTGSASAGNFAAIQEQLVQEKISANDHMLAADKQMLDQEVSAQKVAAKQQTGTYQGMVGEILRSEGSLTSSILYGRRTLSQGIASLGAQLVAREIQQDAQAVTTRLLLAREGDVAQKALAEGGVIYHALFEAQKTAQTAAGVQARVAAHQAGNAIKLASTVAASASETGVAAAAGARLVMADAAKAFSGTYASVAQIPYVGWILAPAAAAAAFAAVAAYQGLASLSVGAWEIPHAMPAMLHPGETVLPRTFAQEYRANVRGEGGSGGGTVHNHSWNIQALDAASFRSFLESPDAREAMAGAVMDHAQKGWRP